MCRLLPSLTLLALLAGLAAAAPVPKARPVVRPEINGGYVMTWHRTLYDTYFLKGGDYVAVTQPAPGAAFQSRWEGTWKLEGDVIHVREQRVIPHTGERFELMSYKFTLKPGKLESVNGDFRLVPATPR